MKTATKAEFKQTEIGMVPADWEVKTIGQLGKVITGKTPRTENRDNFGHQCPFITPRDMKGQKRILETERYLSEEGKGAVGNCVIPEKSVCVSCIGSDMGKVAMATRESVTNQQINSIIPNIPADFAYYAILNISPQLKNLGKQSTAIPILNKSQFSQIEVAVPSRLGETLMISKILSALDSKIELNQQMNRTLETIGKSIFKHWFIDFEFPNEGGGPYKSSGGEMNYNDELEKEIPKGWRVENLGSLCTEVTDGSHFSPKEDIEGSKRIATVGDMGLFDIDPQSCKRISDADYDRLVHDGCKPEKGNVLLSKDGTMGVTHFFNGQDNLVLLSSIAILRLNEELPPSYLYYYLKDRQTQSRLIGRHSSGSALPRIVLKDLKKLAVLVPAGEYLDQFAGLSDPSIASILHNAEISRTLSHLRDSLLPKLMSGRVRVSVEAR